jgi:NAD-dependent deacetylase
MPFLNTVNSAHKLLAQASRVTVLVGPGLSAPSGTPSFRLHGEPWKPGDERYNVSAAEYQTKPNWCWNVLEQARIRAEAAAPNAGHQALAAAAGRRTLDLFTRNADGLLRKAGLRAVELHGSWHRYVCPQCNRHYAPPAPHQPTVPTACANCGRHTALRHDLSLKPNEPRHLDDFTFSLRIADAVLVLGAEQLEPYAQQALERVQKFGKPIVAAHPSFAPELKKLCTYPLRKPAADLVAKLLA